MWDSGIYVFFKLFLVLGFWAEVSLSFGKKFVGFFEFQANPMKLVARIKKIQDEVSSLKDQCRELLTAKQVKKIKPNF